MHENLKHWSMFDSGAPPSPNHDLQVERVSTAVVGQCAGTSHHLPNLLCWPHRRLEIPVQSTPSAHLRRELLLLAERKTSDCCGAPQKLARLVIPPAIRAGVRSSV